MATPNPFPRICLDGLPLEDDSRENTDVQYLKDAEPMLLEWLGQDELTRALVEWDSLSLPQELNTDSPYAIELHHEAKEIYRQAVEHVARPKHGISLDPKLELTHKGKGKAEDHSLDGRFEQCVVSKPERLPSDSFRKLSFGTSASFASTSGDSATTKATEDSSTSIESQAGSKSAMSSCTPNYEMVVSRPKLRWGLTKISKALHRRGPSSSSSLSTSPPVLATPIVQKNTIAAAFGLESQMQEPQCPATTSPKQEKKTPGSRVCQTPIKRTEDILSPTLLTGMYECASCMEEVPGRITVKLDCTHTYCRECFSQMMDSLTQNEIQWPPRCCLTDIPRPMIVRHLSPDQLKSFHQKEKEYSVKAADRWYCTNVPACGKFFIPSRGGRDATTCDHCGHDMCILCRGAAHPNREGCNEDLNLRATLERAEQEGWRSCASCSAIIERTAGCRHMTCTCGYQFCFVCMARWRTCECTDGDLIRTRRNVARRRAQLTQDRTTHERQWQWVREDMDRALAEQQEFDEEGRDFEAALAQIAQQQQADLEERARIEEEEAGRMESARKEGIEAFSKGLHAALEEHFMRLLGALQTRHEGQFVELEHMQSQIEPLERAGRERYHEKLDSHERELQELRQRHVNDMTAFRAHVKKIVAVEASKRRALVADGSDFDFTLRMYDAATSYFDALEEVQDEELRFLQNSHERALNRIASTTQRHISQLLSEVAADYDIQLDESTSIIQRSADVAKRKTVQLASRAVADLKWLQTICGLTASLSQERVEYLLSSGADAPPLVASSAQDKMPQEHS